MRLEEKVILVTGSTTGIGRAIAQRCFEEGAAIIVHGLEPDLADRTRAVLDPGGERSLAIQHDLSERDAPAAVREVVLSRFGRIDGLVNNAALVGTGDIQSTDDELMEHFLRVNLKAPFFLIQAFLPDLSVSGGSVVNIGSVNAYCGEPDLLPYSISKGGLMTLTRNLGDRLHREHGVRVNQINPGWILTENERERKQLQGLPEDWPGRIDPYFAPGGRIFAPTEIAAAAIYFLSDEAGPVSGSVLDVEQYPMIGRNPPKDIPGQAAG